MSLGNEIPPTLLPNQVYSNTSWANEVCIPLIRCNAFIYDKERLWVIFLLYGSELVIVRAEERLLPIKFIS